MTRPNRAQKPEDETGRGNMAASHVRHTAERECRVLFPSEVVWDKLTSILSATNHT